MFSSSHWSLTAGFTNFSDVEELDIATRKKIIKKKPYREGLVWKHFIGDFKNAGFIFRSKSYKIGLLQVIPQRIVVLHQ
jgi:hypothetical protein